MAFHPDSNLPGCMMPDGGDCCEGHAAICEDWHKQRRQIDALVKALTDALCELTACASQLAARGLKGHPGDSVSRAQTTARQVLGAVGPSRDPS